MPQPEGTKQISLYIPRELLQAVDDSVRAMYDGNMRKRTDWVIGAMRSKLGCGRDPRLASLEAAFESMNEDGREWLSQAAEMAAKHGGFMA